MTTMPPPDLHSLESFDSGDRNKKISDIFGENVFSLRTLKDHVDASTYEKMQGVILKQKPMDFEAAEVVAAALIQWAMSKGVTHYTHWFHPLTDSSAEKHDAFFKPSIDLESQGIESLSGETLMQQEPDGSSFPSGGLRVTHEARAYTIWDPSSPPFILETTNGKTLYIPAVFISYTGESLDFKTPLLKANHNLNLAATSVAKLFDDKITHVFSTLGWEQEYFLVDEQFLRQRPDLLLFGRTIFGGKSAKGQQMDDHYFGSIPTRVQDSMRDFEREALKLGIPIVTRHNEVAPGQYECAPFFEETNLAVDHNLLIMDLMKNVAIRHGFRVLLHEKPFAGLNGSGKHNNWSMATSTGKNLLSPGDDPGSNLMFLTFFINILRAIDNHGDLLRAAIASAGNDHRLGANEAPPAIISVFTGTLLADVVKRFGKEGLTSGAATEDEVIDLGLTKIHAITKDKGDRNRTSPFAFIGNRFELRAVGSSANCANPMTMLNTIVATQLNAFKADVDAQIAKGKDKEAALVAVLQGYVDSVDRIVFNGDGYSAEWEKEAAKRGLSNNKTTPSALGALVTDEAKRIFSDLGIFNEREIESRYEVALENYINKIQMESELFQEMGRTHVLPAAFAMINRLGETHRNLDSLGLDKQAKSVAEQIETISSLTAKLNTDLGKLAKAQAKADGKSDPVAMAKSYADDVKPLFDNVRASIDKLEVNVDDQDWRLAKYRELLFIR